MKKILYVFFLIMILTAGCSSDINKEYYFQNLDIEKIWDYSKGKSQTIAFIDTGISNQAKTLYSDKIIDTYNSIENNNKVIDKHGHGTQMVSVASGNGKKGITGIAPKSKIIIIKAFEEGEQMNPSNIVKAINYAISKKVDIINMSFGSFKSNSDIEDAINLAIKNNITVVASTGDYGNKDILFPANMNNVVSVEAKNKEGETWEFSNVSKDDVIAVPGVDINSLTLDNKQVRQDGTSHATAITSGYIALLRDYYTKNNINFDNKKIISDLKSLNSIKNNNIDYLKLFKK
ncbi:hypothetical protein A3863_04915 [Priestia endophytica]|uniref:S8 family peptidase n=1 Tax=Priestia endophytica TaxID=135735 RepID=UPI000DCA520F|nr:S8 family serine peptidase [Priestia endophytica]RAS91821.1 hypothetical protein A3863_04915 [Priestia endophytica]